MQDHWEWNQCSPEQASITERFRGDQYVPREGQLATQTFHTETRLADGRPSVLIDPGSLGNLTGDQWAREAAKTALETGGPTRKPQEYIISKIAKSRRAMGALIGITLKISSIS